MDINKINLIIRKNNILIYTKPIYNKVIELELRKFKDLTSYFNIDINWTTKVDHAGFYLILSLHKYYFSFIINDCRHWNFKENKWYEFNK